VLSSVVRLLRLASIVICLIVVASFAIFAVQQTKSASGRQTEAVAKGEPSTAPAQAAHPASSQSTSHEGAVHKAIDEVSTKLTSPFAGVVSSSSEWASRGVKLLIALVVYGFGLGFLARMLRVRV
jgi:predicted PurR-regulated permease PerM